jgi:YbbR domain-containing protein
VRLPDFLTRNFRLKIGCALLAVVTWGGVVYAGNPPETRPFSVHVPQSPSTIPTGFVLIHPIADLPVRVGGSRSSLNAFNPDSDLSLSVGWRNVRQGGIQWLPVTVQNNDPNVELLDVPTHVQVDLDRLTSNVVPVTIVITANPPPGIQIGQQSASPSSVTAVGPEHEMKGLVARVNVDLSGWKANFEAVLSLYPYNAHGDRLADVELSKDSVTVSVSLQTVSTSRVVAVRPTITGKVSSGYVLSGVTYTPQTVTITGPQDLLNTIDSVGTSPISINGLTSSNTVTVPAQAPAGVSIASGLITVTVLVTPVTPPTPTPSPSPSPSP